MSPASLWVYFGVLVLLLLSLCGASFNFPPVSDDWEALHAFHHLDQKPGEVKWLHVLNHDPFEQMRYQPLSHLFLFVLHRLFGANHVPYNMLNVFLYIVNVFILYRFFRLFSDDRWHGAIAVGVFSLLFTHFDIALWSSHRYILAGFGMILLGFLSFAAYMRSGRLRWLAPVVPLFLLGMWCYEAFAAWPFAVLGLAASRRLRGEATRPVTLLLSVVGTLVATYAAYVAFYFFTRSLGTYDAPAYEVTSFFSFEKLFHAGVLTLFNLVYNTITVNLLPFLPFPLEITENIYMGGPVVNAIAHSPTSIVYAGAAVAALLILALLGCLAWRRHGEVLKAVATFLFLGLSCQAIIFVGRATTNEFVYGLTEFRYQYAVNAFMALTVALLAARFVRLTPRIRRIVLGALLVVAGLNVVSIGRELAVYTRQLSDLRHMLTDIRTGIEEERIRRDAPCFIDDNIHAYLPSLCWNYEMGARFMRGTYQWTFPADEQDCFTSDRADAAWEIDPRDFAVIPVAIAPPDPPPEIRRGKVLQYNTVGVVLAGRGDQNGAIREYRKALDEDPNYASAHYNMARALVHRRDIDGAIRHYQRAIDLNPGYVGAFVNLGTLLGELGRRTDALECFRRAIAIDPELYESQFNYANILRHMGEPEAALRHYRAALRIEPDSHDVYNNIGSLLFELGKFEAAAAELEAANRLHPTARTHVNLGILRTQQGQPDVGRRHLEIALALALQQGDHGMAATVRGILEAEAHD